MFTLYFSGEEDALSFTVWCGDRLQLQEIQQHLDLQGSKIGYVKKDLALKKSLSLNRAYVSKNIPKS